MIFSFLTLCIPCNQRTHFFEPDLYLTGNFLLTIHSVDIQIIFQLKVTVSSEMINVKLFVFFFPFFFLYQRLIFMEKHKIN